VCSSDLLFISFIGKSLVIEQKSASPTGASGLPLAFISKKV
jgi:hypothetical protein